MSSEEASSCKGTVVFTMRGVKLANRCVSELLALSHAHGLRACALAAERHARWCNALMQRRRSDGWFGKSDPFFVISKSREDGTFAACCKSDVVTNNLSPTWKPLRVPLQRLCNGDMSRPLKLEVLDYDKDDKFEEIGHMTVTTQELLTPGWSGKLKHPRGKDKDVGTVNITAAQLLQEPSFVECVHAARRRRAPVPCSYHARALPNAATCRGAWS